MRELRVIQLSACIVLLSTIVGQADEDAPALEPQHGPWLVYVQTYRGKDSQEKAQSLARELKKEHRLPSYVFQDKRNQIPHFAVLVGDAKTPLESESLQRTVLRLKLRSLEGRPPKGWRTLNPLPFLP